MTDKQLQELSSELRAIEVVSISTEIRIRAPLCFSESSPLNHAV